MARFNNGLFGGFTGKLGNLVGYTVNGKQLIRTMGEITKPPTRAQLAGRQKIAVVNRMLKPIVGFINLGFEMAVRNTNRNAYNEAVSFNTKYATTGAYPDITIDYSKVAVSAGNLAPAIEPAINLLEDGVEFTWKVDPEMDYNIKNDRAMLLIYFPKQEEAIYVFSGAKRYIGRDFIMLAPTYLDRELEAYISFVADDRQSISDSMYVIK